MAKLGAGLAGEHRETEQTTLARIPRDLVGVAHVERLGLQTGVPVQREPPGDPRIGDDERGERQPRYSLDRRHARSRTRPPAIPRRRREPKSLAAAVYTKSSYGTTFLRAARAGAPRLLARIVP